MRIVRQLDERLWREFVDQHPQGNVFHTPEMFHVFARAEGHYPTLWAALGNGGHVLALMLPVQITLFKFFDNCCQSGRLFGMTVSGVVSEIHIMIEKSGFRGRCVR